MTTTSRNAPLVPSAAAPVEPIAPVESIEPVEPIAPVELIAPVEPIEPVESAGATNCVADDGRPHVGRATHGGKICSAHAISYRSDGTKRG
jgi:hypothetical protein